MLVQIRCSICKSYYNLEELDNTFIDYLGKTWKRLPEIRYFMVTSSEENILGICNDTWHIPHLNFGCKITSLGNKLYKYKYLLFLNIVLCDGM